jgi:hypothetical protein
MLISEAVEDLAMMYEHMSLLKQEVCRNSALHGITGYKKTRPILKWQTAKHVGFLRKYKE